MNTIKQTIRRIASHFPASLRPDRTPEGREQQAVAASTVHG